MRLALIIVCLFGFAIGIGYSAVAAEGEGYDVTIVEKTDMFMNKDKVATIPESALFHAQKIRDDWVFGTYKDVDTEKVYAGWIEKKTIGDLDKMIESLKAESENYLLDGERRFQEAKYDEAIRLLTESLDRDPKQPHALKLRAQGYMTLGKKTEAFADYSKIIEIAPQSEEAIEALLSRAKMLIETKNYPNAIKDIEQVLKSQPQNGEALLYYGNVMFYQRRYQEALAMYNKGIEAGSTISALQYQRGLTYFNLNMFDESRADLEKAIEMNKENADYRKALAYVNQVVKQLENITPQDVRKILDVKIAQKDDKLMVELTNIGSRPLLNVEVAIMPFIEDTFKKAKEERNVIPGKDTKKERATASNTVFPLEKVEVQGIKFFPGIVRGSTANKRIFESESFSEQIKEKGKRYYGFIVIVFVNKQEMVLRSGPVSLKDDFKDTVMDIYVEVQGEQVKE